MSNVPGWYMDAMETNLGALIRQQAEQNLSTDELVDLLLDPSLEDGKSLTPEDHLSTLAVCVALCVRRLSRIDMPL